MLGFSIAVPPGPVNATTAQKIGSGKSWLSGFSVGCGAMTADAIFLLLTYLGWTRIISGNPSSTSWSYLAGGVIMTVFGALTILGLRKKHGRSSHMVSNGGGGLFFREFQVALALSVSAGPLSGPPQPVSNRMVAHGGNGDNFFLRASCCTWVLRWNNLLERGLCFGSEIRCLKIPPIRACSVGGFRCRATGVWGVVSLQRIPPTCLEWILGETINALWI